MRTSLPSDEMNSKMERLFREAEFLERYDRIDPQMLRRQYVLSGISCALGLFMSAGSLFAIYWVPEVSREAKTFEGFAFVVGAILFVVGFVTGGVAFATDKVHEKLHRIRKDNAIQNLSADNSSLLDLARRSIAILDEIQAFEMKGTGGNSVVSARSAEIDELKRQAGSLMKSGRL